MALSDEEKIAIGVCAGVGGLILIGIILFICIVFWKNRDRHIVHKKRHIYHEDRHLYNDRPYTVMEDYKPPPPLYYGPPRPPSYRYASLPPAPPPPPPPPPVREVREVVYRKPEPLEPVVMRYDGYGPRSDPPPRGAVEKYYRGDFGINDRSEPIVIPLSEPDYLYTGSRVARPTTHYIRYYDDHALTRRHNDRREYGELRRVHSYGDIRDLRQSSRRPYVGEWVAKSDDLRDFNKDAYDKGRDPFLWRTQHKEYDYVRRHDD